jgi:DNA polymerase III subunit alpha
MAAPGETGTPGREPRNPRPSGRGVVKSFSDFLRKVPAGVCNRRVTESLIKAGAFDSLGHSRRGLMLICERAIDSVMAVKRKEAMGQDSLFGGDTGSAAAGDGPDRGYPDGQVVTVGGILSGVQRKVTRQGAAWAAATLEDLAGAAEVLFFPATYQRYASLVADDAIVVVRGRLDRREDTPKLVAMDVSVAEIG